MELAIQILSRQEIPSLSFQELWLPGSRAAKALGRPLRPPVTSRLSPLVHLDGSRGSAGSHVVPVEGSALLPLPGQEVRVTGSPSCWSLLLEGRPVSGDFWPLSFRGTHLISHPALKTSNKPFSEFTLVVKADVKQEREVVFNGLCFLSL